MASKSDSSGKGKKNDEVKLTIVVNGTSVHLKAEPKEPLSSLTEPALKKAGVADAGDLSRWIFKDKEGNVLDKARLIESFGFTDKSTIFLSLEAGAAG